MQPAGGGGLANNQTFRDPWQSSAVVPRPRGWAEGRLR